MPVTLRDIAKRLGLSHATVSFVLNQRLDVAIPDATRQRVIEAAREMGYRPNSLARALVSGRTQMVAICLPVLRHPFYMGVFHSLFDVCQQNGYSVLVYHSFRSPTRRAVDWPVDGVIAVDSSDMIRRSEIPPHLPTVSIGIDVDTEVDNVQIDLSEGTALAMAHLLDVGCERVVRVHVNNFPEGVEERGFAFDQVLDEAGMEHVAISVPKPSPELVRRVVRDHVSEHVRPDAFFCTNELAAGGTLRGMADLGLFAPRDYKLIGLDSVDEGTLLVPSLTAISQPVAIMCRQAMEFLMERVQDPKAPIQSATLPTTLVVRESTSGPANSDPRP